MKHIFLCLTAVLFLSSCSAKSVTNKPEPKVKKGTEEAIKKIQIAWGKKVMKRVRQRWHPPSIQSSEFKKPNAKVKFTISRNGQIEGKAKFNCKGSPSFCSSITEAINKAQPFPLPPHNFSKSLRTINVKLDMNTKRNKKPRNTIHSIQVSN